MTGPDAVTRINSAVGTGPVDAAYKAIDGLCRVKVDLVEYTVNAVNALLTLHALVLHSSCHNEYSQLSGWLGWLMISPIGHNMHHQYGEVNACNFAPIFKLFDRLFGTLNEKEPFWWDSDRRAVKGIKTM